MNHSDRGFSFQSIDREDELVDAMFNHTWPLCYGFYHGGRLYLNDSDEEMKPEYAVLTIDKTEGRFSVLGHEIGRIAPKSMSASDAPGLIHTLFPGGGAEERRVQLTAEPMWHHRCRLCSIEEV